MLGAQRGNSCRRPVALLEQRSHAAVTCEQVLHEAALERPQLLQAASVLVSGSDASINCVCDSMLFINIIRSREQQRAHSRRRSGS